MARTAQIIQADIDALRGNMATGARSVQFSDHSTTFATYDDMRKALVDLEGELALIISNRRRIRRVRFQTSKGL